MAVSTSIQHDNNIVGTPQIGADVDIYETHASPKFPIGQGYERSDGARFRYSHFGVACSKSGLVVAQDFSESGTAQVDSVCVANASTTPVAGEAVSPNNKGSHYIQIAFGGATVDEFAGGYFVVSNGTGIGVTYRIKGNTVSGVPTTGQCYIELFSPLITDLDATSDIGITGNKYANLESATSATDNCVAGITVQSMTAIATVPYGWVQTKGIVGIYTDASPPVTGENVTLSSVTAGNVTEAHKYGAHQLQPIVGYCVDPGATTELSSCYINID